jgi:hypothetical protein
MERRSRANGAAISPDVLQNPVQFSKHSRSILVNMRDPQSNLEEHARLKPGVLKTSTPFVGMVKAPFVFHADPRYIDEIMPPSLK